MVSRTKILWAGLIAGAAAVPMAALASHGKVGLWEVTTQINMPNMAAMMTPDQIAKMQAMGMHMPTGQSFTTQHCMTAEEVAAADKPPPMRQNKDCTVSNMKYAASNFTADMTCTGDNMQGQGHVSVTYDSDEHYSGSFTFTGTAHGHPATMTNNFEGKWISADCGTMK
jgi:Protein of unknown function (DUF3617)